jgi:membrane associated rhomboid family serine protease
MANGAHLAGLIAGFVYGVILTPLLRSYWRNKNNIQIDV